MMQKVINFYDSILGLLKNKLNHPEILPKNSVNASFRLVVVNILLNRMNDNNNMIVFHFNLAENDGFGYFTLQTYHPFRTTILPY